MTARMKGGPISNFAATLGAKPEFWRLVSARTGKPCQSSEEARAYILRVCGIDSRAQLDHVPAAEAKFHAAVRLPWIRWQQGARG